LGIFLEWIVTPANPTTVFPPESGITTP